MRKCYCCSFHVTEESFPIDACRIRRLLELLVNQIRQRLLELSSGRHSIAFESFEQNTNTLANAIQTIHASVRYLQASSPEATPPELQTAITSLVADHVPAALGCATNEIVVLARPQWTYNLKYVDLISDLEKTIEIADLDPEGERAADDLRSFIKALWLRKFPNDTLPLHVAILCGGDSVPIRRGRVTSPGPFASGAPGQD
jgi:hypothetical protein